MDDAENQTEAQADDTNNALDTKTHYVGTKTLKAWPKTLGEYNTYRGWGMPQGEDPDKAGYMVEYENSGDLNVTGHAGYVSWSPADVFEATYTEIPADWRGRVKMESDQLQERLAALKTFLLSSQYIDLPQNAKDLLQSQATYMTLYADVLDDRLASAEPEAAEPEAP